MYDENTFKNYIFWLKVKRVFLMIVLSIVGAILGIVISEFLVDVLLVLGQMYKVIIISVSTLLFFGISLLLTANVGRDVQEGYWKMAVLRKLTVISKKLDNLENLNPVTGQIHEEVAPMPKKTRVAKSTKVAKTSPSKKVTNPTDESEYMDFTVLSEKIDEL